MIFSKKFVCETAEYSTYETNVPAPLFRKSFVLDAVPETAEITICGLGFYDLFVNGKKITKGYLAPYISNSDHICYFDNYDIKTLLTKGENIIGVMLGDGHQVGKSASWDFKDNVMNSAPLLALCAEIKCGENTVTFEADDFVCKKGPVIFNDLRSGVFYDAREEEEGWCAPNFKEEGWHKPLLNVYRPRGYAKLCTAEPIKVQREIKPISITKGCLAPYQCDAQEYIEAQINSITPFETAADKEGGYIYDFGENNAGILRLKIKGERGQKISLQFGEQLADGKLSYDNVDFYPDGFCQRDIYYLKGEGEEIFEPPFTYHGFRYVYVSGITKEQATKELLTYLVMSSDLEKRGTFKCSDDMANKIFEMGLRSDASNFYYFPTDCPHREKNGWTGDAATSAEHMIMTLGTENSWREWLFNIRAAQKENGMLPGIVPTGDWGYEWCNGPAWDRVLFYLPFYSYKYRGETEVIKENAAAMLRYLEYVSKKRNEKGLIAFGLGDWLPVERCDGGRRSDADLAFTDSVMVLVMCRMAKTMFDAVGYSLHKAFAEGLEKEVLAAVRGEYIDPKTYVVKGEYQTTQAMAIFYDIFKEEEKQKAFEVLLDIIKKDNFSITSGYLGLRVIFHVLSDFGEAELAYKMITKPEFPSYGYWVEKGETTFLENFEKYDKFYNMSKNHHFMGDVVNWFISAVAGIKVINSNEVKIKPNFIEKLSFCKASHKLPGGEVSVEWTKENGETKLLVKTTGDVKYSVELLGKKVPANKDGIYLVK